MVILKTIVAQIVATRHPATHMANHTRKVNLRSNNLLYQCTTGDHPLWEAMEESDPSNHTKLAPHVLKRTLVHQSNRCRAWFPVNH